MGDAAQRGVPAETEGGTGPVLFDQDFTWHPTLEVWKLHAWLFRPNPEGVFVDHNPWVQLCPDAVVTHAIAR